MQVFVNICASVCIYLFGFKGVNLSKCLYISVNVFTQISVCVCVGVCVGCQSSRAVVCPGRYHPSWLSVKSVSASVCVNTSTSEGGNVVIIKYMRIYLFSGTVLGAVIIDPI